MLGKHIVVEFYGCNFEKLNNLEEIRKTMLEATKAIKAHILGDIFHRFNPQGVTGIIAISESHLSIHTWPEYGYAAVDIFTCGNVEPWEALKVMKNYFKPKRMTYKFFGRGGKEDACYFEEKLDSSVSLAMKVDNVIFSDLADNMKIDIFENKRFGKVLMIDGKIQLTQADERNYHEAIVHPAMNLVEDARRVLIVGGGDGCSAREVLKYDNVERIDLVDISKTVVDTSKKYLSDINEGALEHEKVNVIISEARKYLEECNEKYDVVIVDSTDPIKDACKLFTLEFYDLVKKKLRGKGAMVTHAGSLFYHVYFFTSVVKTLKQLFSSVFPYSSWIPSYPGGLWGFVLASDSEIDPKRKIEGTTLFDSLAEASAEKFYCEAKGKIITDENIREFEF